MPLMDTSHPRKDSARLQAMVEPASPMMTAKKEMGKFFKRSVAITRSLFFV
jgi:hypothetical protein